MASVDITMISATNLKACNVRLAASLSGDQSDNKQRTPVHKKGSTANTWKDHTFKFTVREAAPLGTRLKFKIEKKEPFLNPFFCFKKGSFFGRKTTYVVGEVDVLLYGRAGDMNPTVRSCEVRSSSLETVAVLKFSYKFSEQFPVEAPPELEEETVTATPAAERPRTGNATPAYFHVPRAGYVPAATPPPPKHHPRRNFPGRVRNAVAVNAMASVISNLVFEGGNFTDA
ncbi:uncharacterized protein LOC125315502 [Rhodamnia argentea]|uniref:Uncharacterized protein LOC125315502 n=1 Tax=Rhodamnia argentea TaxID=178133 RepID=A0ABM3HJ45_9MYRT|nr:uncharacterized protein LOC125315502 [Rhodamnia argentea]